MTSPLKEFNFSQGDKQLTIMVPLIKYLVQVSLRAQKKAYRSSCEAWAELFRMCELANMKKEGYLHTLLTKTIGGKVMLLFGAQEEVTGGGRAGRGTVERGWWPGAGHQGTGLC